MRLCRKIAVEMKMIPKRDNFSFDSTQAALPLIGKFRKLFTDVLVGARLRQVGFYLDYEVVNGFAGQRPARLAVGHAVLRQR